MTAKVPKNFFLLSFLPALAYWYLDEYYPVRIALLGGLALATLELIVEWIFTRHIHTLSKFNFFLIAVLGGISLLGDDGIWFRLQPFFTGVGISSFLFWRIYNGNGLLFEMMEGMGKDTRKLPPKEIIMTLEKHFAIFFLAYAIFMGGVAIRGPNDLWIFFKTAGFYLASFLFCAVEIIIIRRKIKKSFESMRVNLPEGKRF